MEKVPTIKVELNITFTVASDRFIEETWLEFDLGKTEVRANVSWILNKTAFEDEYASSVHRHPSLIEGGNMYLIELYTTNGRGGRNLYKLFLDCEITMQQIDAFRGLKGSIPLKDILLESFRGSEIMIDMVRAVERLGSNDKWEIFGKLIE